VIIPHFIYEPTVALRGTRDYLHSTDIYDLTILGAKIANLSFEGPLNLKIKARIICEPRLNYFFDNSKIPESAVTFKFKSGDKYFITTIEERLNTIKLKKNYDESAVFKLAKIDGRKAYIESETFLTPIETLTALGVFLNKNVFPLQFNERWMLGQLSISRPLCAIDSRRMLLIIDKNIGLHMNRIRIEAHDGYIGNMIFLKFKW
jgi:hypothetical protein